MSDKENVYTMHAVLLFILAVIIIAISPAIVIWAWRALL